MARARTPKARALVSGRAAHDPQRFRSRCGPLKTRPVGEPYPRMTETQKAAWRDHVAAMPWLHGAHRVLLRLACIWTARMDEGDLGINATQALSSILSKLGATPVDEARLALRDDETPSPDDRFFQ